MQGETDERLPRDVKPERYQITLSPDLAKATFAGEETVSVQVLEETSEIVLNALDLDILSARVTSDEGAELTGKVNLDPAAGRVRIGLAEVLGPGSWNLHLTFAGTLNDKLRGFYRSTFTDSGTEHVIATTQFEPTDARRAFPCWDEPDLKAVFSLSLVIDGDLTAVSNTPVAEQTDLGDRRTQIRFADTIPMSTYLVALVVGPLEATDPVEVDGVALRVVHRPGKGHLCSYALEVGAHALGFFARWFGVQYPGRKLDLVALPDFAAGAMENLGAVTFREPLLLVDPGSASRLELERIADVISHEVAHMWFGDLVTMSWWNGLWLNEAFATFMEMLCVDDYKPEWRRWASFGRSRGAAMVIDGLASTRPVEFPVGRPEEAEGMFDLLTYEKGAGVLRMLERYLSAERFRSGIRAYLDAHLFGNADTTDLWDAIEAATGEPVRSTMDTWIFQGGYPLVTVSLPAAGGDRIRLDQEPFRYRRVPPEDGDEDRGGAWQVPLLLRAGSSRGIEHERVLLGPEGATLGLPGPPEWVVANSGGSGFYRVRYSSDLLEAITSDLSRLDALERFNLVSDTWASALAGLSPLEDFVGLVRLLGDEPDANVWSIVVGAVGLLDRVVIDTDRPVLEAFVRGLLGPPFERLGWEARDGEPETTGTLRATLLEALGTVGADPAVRERAARLHADALSGTSEPDPDLAGALVAIAAATGGERDYEDFLARYREPRNPQEEIRYLYGLAGFREPDLLSRTLQMAADEVRTQNAPFLIGLAIANRPLGESAWQFVMDNWDLLLGKFPDNTIPRMLDPLSLLVDRRVAAGAAQFCSSHPVRSGQRTVQQILERQEVNVAFAVRERPSLARVLA